VKEDGSFEVEKVDVPSVPNNDYPEYLARTKPRLAVFLLGAGLLTALAVACSLLAGRRTLCWPGPRRHGDV